MIAKKRLTSEGATTKPSEVQSGIDLKDIFRAPDESASDSDMNNPWNFRSWWNTIQAQDSSDYIVQLHFLSPPSILIGTLTTVLQSFAIPSRKLQAVVSLPERDAQECEAISFR